MQQALSLDQLVLKVQRAQLARRVQQVLSLDRLDRRVFKAQPEQLVQQVQRVQQGFQQYLY